MGSLKFFLLVCLMLVVKSKAGPQSFWKRYASTLLCEHPGSRSDKALKIRKSLHDIYPGYSWYVSVMDDNVSGSYLHDTSSEVQQWKNKCGYNMFIWYKEDSKIAKGPCSYEDVSIVEDILRIADSHGFSRSDVLFDIERLMKQIGIGFHLISVDNGNRHSSHDFHLSKALGCSVARSNNYDVFVYIE